MVKEKKTTKLEEILEAIENMTILEVSELAKALQDKFGVSVPVATQAQAQAPPVEEKAEKSEFTVLLTSSGEKKIQVIKEVRSITNLGLKEAKALVDEAPKPVKEGLPKKEAEELKAKLEAVGATVELK